MKEKFYITSSIAYTNASPHIGFALELIQADVIARYQRLLGKDVFFLTGTDEHGIKIVRAAAKAGKTPKKFTDEISEQFKNLTKTLNLSNNDFIRTSDQKRHWPNVQRIWLDLLKKGDIYKEKYQGFYCVGCESFIKEIDLVDGKCPIHQQKPEFIEEENYFFKLSEYASQVKEKIISGKLKIIPEGRRNEILSFIDKGIEDISCSRARKNLRWGIPVPKDDTQTIYIWFEALINYLYPQKYWPVDVHCIGKDIFRFHALLWPAMLLALDYELPKTIFVHGYLTSNGQKMSKSLGNIVDPFKLVKRYGTDAARHFLLREIPSTEDGDFTYEKFEKRYNADLASGLGNLVARVTTLAKNSNFQYPTFDQFPSSGFRKTVDKNKKACINALEEFKFNESLRYLWDLIGWCDKYIEKERPWSESEKQKQLIGSLLFALKRIAKLLEPFLPETSEKILKQLETKKSEPLFPRL